MVIAVYKIDSVDEVKMNGESGVKVRFAPEKNDWLTWLALAEQSQCRHPDVQVTEGADVFYVLGVDGPVVAEYTEEMCTRCGLRRKYVRLD